MEIVLRVNNLTDENRTHKFEAAATELAKAMKVPATIKKKPGEGKELYPYRAQEELYQRQMNAFGLAMDELYSRVCVTVGFVPTDRFSKAIDPKAPKLGKEIIWNPETGKPISQKDLDRLLNAVDKYLNKNIKSKGEEMVISQAAVARIISNLRQNGASFEELKDKPLSSLKTPGGKPWDSISTYGGLLRDFPGDYEGLRFTGDRVMGNHITGITDNIRSGIVNVLDDGFSAGLTRGQMSQMLFDRFGSYNKDWDRLIDTEGVNVFNRQYIAEQIQDVPAGEPVYFIRREFFDNKTCRFCMKAQQDVIAKWVDRPRASEEIDDPVASVALWAGKSNYGRKQDDWWWAEGAIHPNCRGSWDRYYPEYEGIEL
jgi:hypothetical protein